MNFDNDRLLLARAELLDLLECLRLTNFGSNPVLFLTRLERIRENAKLHRFTAIAEIASAFEISLQRVIRSGGSDSVIPSFIEIMRDAADYSPMDNNIAQPLLASVAIRLQA